jgi:uncharacterized membrane protein
VKKYFIAGLLVWLPLIITIWVLASVLGLLDGVFLSVLNQVQRLVGPSGAATLEWLRDVPGLGILILIGVLLLTGMFVTNIFGQWAFRQWDRLLNKIPIVRSIYSSVKQVSDTLFSSSGQAFREAVLVQYPRAGSWTIAFVTGRPGGEVAHHLDADYVSLYVPTTPNPTSGFFLMMPRSDVVTLTMSVDEALKYIISMGVVAPPVARHVVAGSAVNPIPAASPDALTGVPPTATTGVLPLSAAPGGAKAGAVAAPTTELAGVAPSAHPPGD